MRIGISTGCLYPVLTEESIKILLSEKFDIIEIFFNTFSELKNDYLDRISDMLSESSAQVVSIHPFTSSYESFLLFSGYQRRFEDGAAFYQKYFRTAARLGADKVILHGMKDDFSVIDKKEYCRRFNILYDIGTQYCVHLLQENVNLHCGNKTDFINEMKCSMPRDAGFVLDVKQALRGGMDPCELAALMGSRLRHVHISDSNNGMDCVLPGKGIFDFERFFGVLKQIGYNGDIIIEVYGNSYKKICELTDAKAFLAQFI